MEKYLDVPKLRRYCLNPCNIYQIIFENTYTKEIIVYKTRDLHYFNKLRFKLIITGLPSGTYKYYVINDNDWRGEELDWNNIRNSSRIIPNGAVVTGDKYIVIGNKLLVTKYFTAKLVDSNLLDIEASCETLATTLFTENEPEGDIIKILVILATGLVNITNSTNEPVEYKEQNKSYKEYEG